MTFAQLSPLSIGSLITFGEVDGDGVEWGYSTVEGWHMPAGMDVNRVQRIGSHGEFAQAGHRTGRVITITGWMWAANRAVIVAAAQQLSTVLADGGFETFTFNDSDVGELWTPVQLLDMDVDWLGTAENPPRFQLQLLATDPYKYGGISSSTTGFFSVPAGVGLVFDLFPSGTLDFNSSSVVTGTVTVSNAGTADAPVVFTVDGPTPVEGFNIVRQSDGQTITWLSGEEIPTGSTVVLDGTDGSVTLDGTADRRGTVLVDVWPVVPPGGSEDFLFSSNGADTAASLTASVTSTYW
jgi:hypothetical protein